MASEEDALASAATNLDRAELDTYEATKGYQQDGHLRQTLTAAQGEGKKPPTDTESNLLARVRHVTTKVKSKLHLQKDDETCIHGDQRVHGQAENAPTLAPPASAARDGDRFFKALPDKPSGATIKEVAIHPVKTLKAAAGRQGGNAYAENLAKTEVTHSANVNIVQAYENLASTIEVGDRTLAMQDLEKLKKSRQDSFVRWTIDRHVQKVKRVEAIKLPRRPKREFVERIDEARHRTRWREYGDYLLHYYIQLHGAQYTGTSDQLPKPTESTLISSFERVVLTSAPYQSFLMELRQVSLWKQPDRSSIYMTMYFVLWWYDGLTAFTLLVLLSMVIKRRYYHPTIDELRKDLERSEDAEFPALNIPQLIEQHGPHGWVDALIESAGAPALLHLEDLTNFLEVLRNFYEWRDPSHTRITLGKLTLISLILIITPSRLLVKGNLFAIGLIFFVLAPIWHRYPQYRLLASPLKWIFWKVPTNAEWAIARLQAEAAYQLREMESVATKADNDSGTAGEGSSSANVTDAPSHDSASPIRPVGRYHCTSCHRHGNLSVTTQAVAFKQHLTKDRSWQLDYDRIKSMQKIVGSSTVSSGDDLHFIDVDGNEFRAAGLSARDEVFTQIIGYSKVQWQITA